MPQPTSPIYIPSKGRFESRLTIKALDKLGCDYRVIVEQQEFEAYAGHVDRARLLVLDPAYQRDYKPCMDLPADASRGSGPARNFAWDHAVSIGADFHWVMDDNIRAFVRLNENRKFYVHDGTIFHVMEQFAARYMNLGMCGPNYDFFAKMKQKIPAFVANTKLYSCILIRNDIPFRWRGRYNEDVELSLRVLKAGYCTVQFNAFLQCKLRTQTMRGGNTDAFYAAEGTLPKSQMLARLHPDVARVVWKFGRWHHHVDYRPFAKNKLVRRPDVTIADGVDEFGMQLVTA